MAYLTKNNLFALALATLIVIESISILELILTPVAETTAPDPIVGLTTSIFGWLIPLSPFLLLCLLYSPLLRAGIFWGSKHSKLINRLADEFRSLKLLKTKTDSNSHHEVLALLEHERVMMVVSLIVATLGAYIPYRVDLNPHQTPVGVDTSRYVSSLAQMLQKPLADAVTYAFRVGWDGSRPFLLLAVYFAARLGGIDASVVMKYLPAVLAPLLVLSSFAFVRLAGWGKREAGITMLLTAFSPVLVVGIWAGYYANWLAIIEGFALLGVLLAHLRTPSNLKLALMMGLSVALLLTHPWTWVIFISVVFVFFLSLRRELSPRFLLKIGGSILVVDVITEFVRSALLGGYGAAASREYLAGSAISPFSNILAFWPNLVYGVVFTYDGLLANSIILGFAVISVVAMRYGNRSERLILVWVALTSLVFPFYNDLLQTRLTYNVPITIMASFGLVRLISSERFRDIDRLITVLFVILFNANYALIALSRSLPVI